MCRTERPVELSVSDRRHFLPKLSWEEEFFCFPLLEKQTHATTHHHHQKKNGATTGGRELPVAGSKTTGGPKNSTCGLYSL